MTAHMSKGDHIAAAEELLERAKETRMKVEGLASHSDRIVVESRADWLIQVANSHALIAAAQEES